MPNDSFIPHNGFTPAPPSIGKTMHDGAPLPNGKRLGEERKLTSVLIAAGVPGVDHSMGREIVAGVYAAHLNSIGNAAAEKAVADWLESKRPA